MDRFAVANNQGRRRLKRGHTEFEIIDGACHANAGAGAGAGAVLLTKERRSAGKISRAQRAALR